MSPREVLKARIAELADIAEQRFPDGVRANELLSDIRVYLAACGATVAPRKTQEGVSAGTLEDARRVYGA